MSKYPECFPDNFETEILPNGARQENKRVYRIIKYGALNKKSFYSTFQETQENLRPVPKRGMDLSDPGTYSTSCNMEYDEAAYMLKIFMRHNPKVFIAVGETEGSCGPCQLTSEREERTDTHVDWWIYDEAEPQVFFEEVKNSEE